MKVAAICYAIGILLLCGIVAYQDHQIQQLKADNLETMKFQNELGKTLVLQHQTQRIRNIEVAWELRGIREGNRNAEEFTAFNVKEGKLVVPDKNVVPAILVDPFYKQHELLPPPREERQR